MVTSRQFRVLFWIVAIVWFVALAYAGQTVPGFFKPASIAWGLAMGVAAIFNRWAWRWPIFNSWLAQTPDLRGTYSGHIISQWKNAAGETLPPIPAYLGVNQTLTSTTIRLYTAESCSCSVASSFMTTADHRKELLYTYQNDPKIEHQTRQPDRSPMHYGGAKLTLSGKQSATLEGPYWTGRASIGDMKFKRISRTVIHSFEEGREQDDQTRNR